jgi:hypothetical protein
MASAAATPGSAARSPVYVHIGAAKTGTTYLQTLFDAERGTLREAGLLYPACGGNGHVREALDLRHATFRGETDPRPGGSWRRMVTAIKRWNGPALISSELLAPARPPHIERLVSSLGFADIHIVLTVRDLARQLPAAWQERVKNRGSESFAEWLRLVHQPEPRNAGSSFWALHDIDRIVEKWSAHVPPERFHVVTVPAAGGDRSLLWKRFASVIAVDPQAVHEPDSSVNTSLGAAEVSVVRAINIALGGDAFPWQQYDRLMKWYLAPQLATRRGVPIELSEKEYEWAVERSRQIARAITAAGVDVVGDLAELVPTGRITGLDPDHVPGELRFEAAIAAITALIDKLVSDATRVQELRAAKAEPDARASDARTVPD